MEQLTLFVANVTRAKEDPYPGYEPWDQDGWQKYLKAKSMPPYDKIKLTAV